MDLVQTGEFTTTGTAEQGGFLRICLVSWQIDGVFSNYPHAEPSVR